MTSFGQQLDPEDEFLTGGGGGVAAAFTKHTPIGQEVGGKVLSRRKTQQREFRKDGTLGDLRWWDEAKTQPREQLEVVVQTNLRDNSDDDGRRRHFLKGDLYFKARDAVLAVGHRGVKVGSEFYATRISQDPQTDAWIHQVRYIPGPPPEDTFLTGDDGGAATQQAAQASTGNGHAATQQAAPYDPNAYAQQSPATPGGHGTAQFAPATPATQAAPATQTNGNNGAGGELTAAEKVLLGPKILAAAEAGNLSPAEIRETFKAQLTI